MSVLPPFADGFLGVEIKPDGGSWLSVVNDLHEDGVAITRSAVDAGRMTLTLKNPTGRYSPRNPRSDLYGTIRRGTPVRAYVNLGPVCGRVWQLTDGWTMPDTAATSITGDLDLRVDLHPQTWRPASSARLGWAKTGSYLLALLPSGKVQLSWSTDGTNYTSVSSTAPVPGTPGGRRQVRAVLDVDNGASGWTVIFYVGVSGGWVSFGDVITGAGVTSIYNSTSDLALLGSSYLGEVQIFSAEVRSGLMGAIVAASPTFAGLTAGATSFTDAQGNTWTATGDAEVSQRSYRFWGEVVGWPQKWGTDGDRNSVAELECSGPLRRMAQGATPARSPLYRTLSAIGGDLVAYWPCEDAQGAANVGAFRGRPGTVVAAPNLAASTTFTGSDGLPTLQSGGLSFTVPAYTVASPAYFQLRHLGRFPSGLAANSVLYRVNMTGGTIAAFVVKYNAGSLICDVLDGDDTVLLSITNALATADVKARYSLEVTQSGANVSVSMIKVEVGASSGVTSTATVTGQTISRVTSVVFNPKLVNLGETVIGHVTLERVNTSVFDVSRAVLTAYTGETAATRIERIGSENGLWVRTLDSGESSQALGPQGLDDFLTVMREAEAADGGMLFEPRSGPYDLAYRAQHGLFSREPSVSIAYTDNLLELEPVDDDSGVTNRVTVERDGGSSFTTEVTDGTLGTATVGYYDTSATLSLSTDDAAERRADWLAAQGTADLPRYPTLTIPLEHPTFLADAELTRQVLSVELGEVVKVSDLPAWLPPTDVQLLVQSVSETIQPRSYRIDFKGVPAQPLRVARWAVASGSSVLRTYCHRWSGSGTVTSTALTASSGSTSVTVTPPSGTAWTVADGPYDVVIGGERMTVTAVTALSGGTQTMTVTRSVNGVLTAHPTGQAVALADPSYYGL